MYLYQGSHKNALWLVLLLAFTLLAVGMYTGVGSAQTVVDKGGWYGPFAVSGENVYWISNGKLYRSALVDGGIKSIFVADANWTGPFAIDGGNIYWAINGHLYRSPLSDGRAVTSTELGNFEATGPFFVDGGNIYWTNNGNLYRSPLAGTIAPTVVDYGGWTNSFAVSGKNVYWTKSGIVYGSPLGGRIKSRAIGKASWTGSFAVSGSNIYWATNGNLYRSSIKTSTPVAIGSPSTGGSQVPAAGIEEENTQGGSCGLVRKVLVNYRDQQLAVKVHHRVSSPRGSYEEDQEFTLRPHERRFLGCKSESTPMSAIFHEWVIVSAK
jgi:hypothetical protein